MTEIKYWKSQFNTFFSDPNNLDFHSHTIVDVTIDTKMLIEFSPENVCMKIICQKIKINVCISKQQQMSIPNLQMNNVKVVASNQAHHPNLGEVSAQLQHHRL